MWWRCWRCCQRSSLANWGREFQLLRASLRPRQLAEPLHAWAVAARLGYSEMALRYFRQSAANDLSDTGIDGGVHIAALGGNWMLVVLGFAGLSLRSDGISLDPKLPATGAVLRSLFSGAAAASRSRSAGTSNVSKQRLKMASR